MTYILAMMTRHEAYFRPVADVVGAFIVFVALAVLAYRQRLHLVMSRSCRDALSRLTRVRKWKANRAQRTAQLRIDAAELTFNISRLQAEFALPANDTSIGELDAYRQSVDQIERSLREAVPGGEERRLSD